MFVTNRRLLDKAVKTGEPIEICNKHKSKGIGKIIREGVSYYWISYEDHGIKGTCPYNTSPAPTNYWVISPNNTEDDQTLGRADLIYLRFLKSKPFQFY